MDDKSKDFLYQYLNNASPVGYELSGQNIWSDYIRPYVQDIDRDMYGSRVAVINRDAKYKVVVEAHADEISWLVSKISASGYLSVCRNGGSDASIAPSMRVDVHGDDGIVKGVFGWPAIHIREKEVRPEVKSLFVDIGAESKEEVEKMGVHIGDVITMEASLFEMNGKYLVGKSLDDKIGGFIVAEVAKRMYNVDIPFGVYFVNSVQEEVGLRGSAMVARRIKPDVALCIDVGHDTSFPGCPNDIGDFKCGGGPILSWAAPVQNNLLKFIVETVQRQGIIFQREASPGSTGTDTDAFAYATEGCASAAIGVPLRYMHTTVEMVHKDDIESTIKLLCEVLKSLKNGQDFRY